ncbi:putative transcription factor interactor and regulator CCHC(Zn) family [Helianthus anomalus]
MAKDEVNPKEKLSEVFVAGKNTVAEKDYIFSQKAVDDFNVAKRLKDETNRSTFVEYEKRICYRCNEIGHMAKQCVKKIEKTVFQKPKPKTSNDVKGKTPMISPLRILKQGESLKSEDKPKSTFEIGESSKTQKTSKVYPKKNIFQNPSWVEKPKRSFEEKKMEKDLKSESKVFATDVEELEFELDKLIEEFPPIKEGDLKSKSKTVVPNVVFNIPKVDVSYDLVFGSVQNVKKSWASLFE